jgi:hypothetical protein
MKPWIDAGWELVNGSLMTWQGAGGVTTGVEYVIFWRKPWRATAPGKAGAGLLRAHGLRAQAGELQSQDQPRSPAWKMFSMIQRPSAPSPGSL